MPCGKRLLVKKWDKHKNIRVITPSRYEQNEASVKVHWKKVIRELELSYKDDKPPKQYSVSSYEPPVEEQSIEEEESDWLTSSEAVENQPSRYKSITKSKSTTTSKLLTSKFNISKMTTKSLTRNRSSSRSKKLNTSTLSDSLACTDDDIIVQGSKDNRREYKTPFTKSATNPHFDMLYCNESETDMIKWNSKYKQKGFEISASDEFSKKAEILTKQISKEFYDWWVGLGNTEIKSEIKRPEDIEDLFQVLFDEHASRALVLDPKILPCVLPSIAEFVGVPKTSCPSVLKRQIAYDIHAETSPVHKEAFGTCLPQKMKHIPPNNDTKKMWHSLVIPEDLKTMSAVWGEISHLTSTKAFHAWLQKRPHLPMAKYLKSLEEADDKKQAFVVPSDYVLAKEGASVTSTQDLALPVSEFTLELKEVLQEIMND